MVFIKKIKAVLQEEWKKSGVYKGDKGHFASDVNLK